MSPACDWVGGLMGGNSTLWLCCPVTTVRTLTRIDVTSTRWRNAGVGTGKKWRHVVHLCCFGFIQRLPNGPSSLLDDVDVDRQRESEIERQRSELGQLKERLALMCRQVILSPKQHRTSPAADANSPPGPRTSLSPCRWGRSRSS